MNIINTEKFVQNRQNYARRQYFGCGMRKITHHWILMIMLLAYLWGIVWALANADKIPMPIPQHSTWDTVLYGSIRVAFLLVSVISLIEIIIALGTPKQAEKIQNALVEAGFTNSVGFPPLLLSMRKEDKNLIYEFDSNNMPLSQWDSDKDKIGAALHREVAKVEMVSNGNRVILHTCAPLPEKIYWKDAYLSKEDFVLILGMDMTSEIVSVDIATTPHLLLGGSTGSGKSLLLKCLLMQSLRKEAIIILADFKGGVDYAPIWHQKCKMVFEPQDLLAVLDELIAEMERRRKLFVAAGTSNLNEYNQVTGKHLQRYILACDEVAEILDKTGLDKAERALLSLIEKRMSLIARQGRAFGIHLFLSTQRPSAELIPGEIRTNLTLRICGRADNILSRIILDNTDAAEQIMPDAKGRFITSMGQSFQGFLFDDSILEE